MKIFAIFNNITCSSKYKYLLPFFRSKCIKFAFKQPSTFQYLLDSYDTIKVLTVNSIICSSLLFISLSFSLIFVYKKELKWVVSIAIIYKRQVEIVISYWLLYCLQWNVKKTVVSFSNQTFACYMKYHHNCRFCYLFS